MGWSWVELGVVELDVGHGVELGMGTGWNLSLPWGEVCHWVEFVIGWRADGDWRGCGVECRWVESWEIGLGGAGHGHGVDLPLCLEG
jgi:hypothetical protein